MSRELSLGLQAGLWLATLAKVRRQGSCWSVALGGGVA